MTAGFSAALLAAALDRSPLPLPHPTPRTNFAEATVQKFGALRPSLYRLDAKGAAERAGRIDGTFMWAAEEPSEKTGRHVENAKKKSKNVGSRFGRSNFHQKL